MRLARDFWKRQTEAGRATILIAVAAAAFVVAVRAWAMLSDFPAIQP